MKHTSVLFLRPVRRFCRTVRSVWKRPVADCRGHGTDGLGGEYAGNGELWSSSLVDCASSAVASAYPGGLDGGMCAALG